MTLRSDAFIPRLRSNDPAIFELSFADKRPTGSTLRLLGDALKKNTSLKRLDLSNCSLNDVDVIPLLQLLACNQGLTHLSIQGNLDLTNVTADAIINCIIDRNKTLSRVGLDGTSIETAKAENIGFLTSLNKFPQQLKPQAFRARANEQNFFTFELTHDPSDPKVYNEESARIVAECLAHNTVVRTLKLNRCCMGEHSLRELRTLFQLNTTLRRVALQDNFLSSDSAVMIAAALSKAGNATAMEDIDLSVNDIDDVGCDALSTLLHTNTTIRVVSLLRNRCSQVALDRLRTGCALNCEPAELKPLLPRLAANDAAILVVDMPGTADTAARGPGRGYFTSLGAATISEALLFNTTVHTINLARNHIGPDGAKAIASLIARNTTVTSIDLSGNPMQDEGARHLILALRQNDNVVSLNADGSNVSSKSTAEIASLCHINAQPLPIKQLLAGTSTQFAGCSVLDLSYRPTQPLGKWSALHAESMPYVATIIKKYPCMTEVDLSDNVTLGDEGVLQLVALLRDPACQVKKLLVCNTSITDISLSALADAVAVNYTIKSIVASPNSATTTKPQQRLDDAVQLNQFPAAVKDLIPPLKQNVMGISTVKFVRAPDETPYGDDAVRVLVSALSSNSIVTSVTISGHRVSNRGMAYISELLLRNTSIVDLDLSDNDVGPDGVEEFAAMLEQNVTLTRCNLTRNALTESGGVLLLKALQMANRTLTSLHVASCRLLESTKLKIEAHVAANGQPAFFRSHILEKLSGLPVVKFIGDVSTGFLDGKSLDALSMFLKCLPTTAHVRALELPHNKIGDAGLSNLAEVVGLLPNITTLDLTDNGLTEGGCRDALVAICKSCPKLCDIKALPAGAVSTALEAIMSLHQESSAFQSCYARWEQVLPKHRADSRIVLELTEMPITSTSIDLLCSLLQAYGALKDVQALSIVRCTLSVGAVPALVSYCGRMSLEGIQIAETPLDIDCARSLVGVAARKELVLFNTDDRFPSSLGDELRSIVAQNRIAKAIGTVEHIFAKPQKVAQEAAARRPGARSAAGNPMAAVRSLEQEAAALAMISQDALQEMPQRTPYHRGMYSRK